MLSFDVKVVGGIRFVRFLTSATNVVAAADRSVTRPLFDFYAVFIEGVHKKVSYIKFIEVMSIYLQLNN